MTDSLNQSSMFYKSSIDVGTPELKVRCDNIPKEANSGLRRLAADQWYDRTTCYKS
jgi:hypothetical protein